MWAAETCETRPASQTSWRIRLKCSFLCMPHHLYLYTLNTLTRTRMHTHSSCPCLICYWNTNEWWQDGAHWKESLSWVSKCPSELTISPAPRYFPGVSFWIYPAGLRPWFFHLNIIQENIRAKLTSSPSSDFFLYQLALKFPWRRLYFSQTLDSVPVFATSPFPLCLSVSSSSAFISYFFFPLLPISHFILQSNTLRGMSQINNEDGIEG